MMTQAVKAMNSNPAEATLNLTDPANPGWFRCDVSHVTWPYTILYFSKFSLFRCWYCPARCHYQHCICRCLWRSNWPSGLFCFKRWYCWINSSSSTWPRTSWHQSKHHCSRCFQNTNSRWSPTKSSNTFSKTSPIPTKESFHSTLPVQFPVTVLRWKFHENFERLGDPEHFADMILTMIDNPMMNGETVRLDGCIRMPP